MTAGSLEFWILGSLEVSRAGRPVVLRTGKAQSLLARLLVDANAVVPVERIIDDLWGAGVPATARNILQVYVSRLRRTLEPERTPDRPWQVLVWQPPGYVLRVDPDQIDAVRFERLVREARADLAQGEFATAARMLRAALALWRGEALADFAGDSFAQAEAARLEELRLSALEDRIDADLALGRQAELAGEVEALVAEHPLRERLQAQLMLALYRCGRQADALRVYADVRRALIDQLGLEPGPALQALQRQILVHDAELATPPPTAPDEAFPVAGGLSGSELRKQVTLVLAELRAAGGGGRLDVEAMHGLMTRSLEVATETVEQHGGAAERLVGTVVAGVFGLPVVSEDDAVRAVRAAAELDERLGELCAELERSWSVSLESRLAVVTGDVLVSSREDLVLAGDLPDRGLRLVHAAAAGQVLLDDATEPLVRGTVELVPAAAGRLEPAWGLVGARREDDALRLSGETPMVGRRDELGQLLGAFERARDAQVCYLFTLLGEAGIGKSRLARELCERVHGRATVLTGRCWPYGEGVTFLALAQIVREAAGGTGRGAIERLLTGEPDAALVAEQVAAAIGPGEGVLVAHELFRAVRRLLEVVARRRPLVVVVDDLHCAGPTFLDLLEHVALKARGAPILLLCLSRSELLETRPGWGGGVPNAASVELGPLSPSECADLVERLLGPRELAPGQRERVVGAAEGNPLFVEQLLEMALEGGAQLEKRPLPPTIHAVLAARLDRLEQGERQTIARGAVIGKEFRRSAVEQLLAPEDRPGLDRCLEAIVARELVSRIDPAGDDDPAYRFRHGLIRDAAYRLLPKEARGELHERFAAWLEHAPGEGAVEEIVGHHLEQAYRYRVELAPMGEHELELADRAADLLASAGRRAFARGDTPGAAVLLRRASSLASEERALAPLLADLAEVLRENAEFADAKRAVGRALVAARAAGDEGTAWRARIVGLRLRLRTDPTVVTASLRRQARRAIATLERIGDEAALAKAWSFMAELPWLECRAAESDEASMRAIEYARRVGDARTEARSLNLGSALLGPTPAAKGIRRCEEVLETYSGQLRCVAAAYRALAGFSAMSGRFDDVLELIEKDRAILHDLGLTLDAAYAAEAYGLALMIAGDPAAAERHLGAGFDTFARVGEKSGLSTLAAMLAQALYAQGRYGDALRYTRIAESSASSDDVTTQVQWRGPRAKVVARRGSPRTAVRLAREAVDLAAQTDFLNMHGYALVDFAEVLGRAGRQEAAAALEGAIALFDRKGNVVGAAHARARLDQPTLAAVE